VSPLRAGVKTAVRGEATCEFPIEENVQDAATLPSKGKMMCTVFWDGKGVILLDFLEPGQTTNSDRYIATLTKLKARISRVRPERRG